MRYSIQDEELNKIRELQEEVSNNIENLYNEYVDSINEWGKKFNSELVYNICKKTIGIIDEDYCRVMKDFAKQFSEMGISFKNISKRYKVGEDALGKVSTFQNDMLENTYVHNTKDIQYFCDGNSQYSTDLIREYKDIFEVFYSGIETSYEEYYPKIIEIRNINILGDGIECIVKYQYETIQKFGVLYNDIFERFLEWYGKVLHENDTLLEEINLQMKSISIDISEKEIEKLLLKIIDETHSKDDGLENIVNKNFNSKKNEDYDTEEENNRRNQAQKSSRETVKSLVDSLLKELDSPEKIRDFKEYILECQQKYEDYNKSNDKIEKKSKFKKLCNVIKKGAKKYTLPTLKALGIVLPLFLPEAHIISLIAKNLPKIMECFTGVENNESDIDKIGLGLEFMKSLGVEKLPEDCSEIKGYFEENGEVITKSILKKIFSSEKYMKVLEIDTEELNKSENRVLYEKITGEKPLAVPLKRKAYNNFNQYDLSKISNISPVENEEKCNMIVEDIKSNIDFADKKERTNVLFNGIDDVYKQINEEKGYVTVNNNSELSGLIKELRKIVNAQVKEEVLPNVEGRYNKRDIGMLCEEIEREKNKIKLENRTPNITKACQNFVRRQLGYPAQYENLTVKELDEIIPILNKNINNFTIENSELTRHINNAKKFINSKNNLIKRKSITSLLKRFGIFLGIGATILIATTSWPLGVLPSILPILSCFTDEGAKSYGYLTSVIGEERVESLLKNYSNVDGNYNRLVD